MWGKCGWPAAGIRLAPSFDIEFVSLMKTIISLLKYNQYTATGS